MGDADWVSAGRGKAGQSFDIFAENIPARWEVFTLNLKLKLLAGFIISKCWEGSRAVWGQQRFK